MIRDWHELPLLLTQQQIAKLFGYSSKTIYRRLLDPTGDEIPMPINPKAKRKLWSREAVREWIESRHLEDPEAAA